MRRTVLCFALFALCLIPAAEAPAQSQPGYDYTNRQFIDLPNGDIRPGDDVEVYIHGQGYRRMRIQDTYNHGRGRNVIAIDPKTGKRRVIELGR